jgi:hypothetical protein
MNLGEKPHQNADCSVGSVHRRSLVSRIRKPFLSEFITASSKPQRGLETVLVAGLRYTAARVVTERGKQNAV